MVKRNVTLPAWFNYEAEKSNLNVSKFLQEALKEKFSQLSRASNSPANKKPSAETEDFKVTIKG